MTQSLRKLPSVSSLLLKADKAGVLDRYPRSIVTNAIRAVLDRGRSAGGREPEIGWLAAVEQEVASWRALSLVRVINATGVVLHTNLGRAPLPAAAKEAVAKALEYSTLEFDTESGGRGSRQQHVRGLLKQVTGAEDALVVNNAAAALLLTVNTLAAGGETVISRGELLEIGGSFRLPDIIAKSESRLVEVGTTNRTHSSDYQGALTERTSCLLKVHRSNFTLEGFVSDVHIAELVRLGEANGIPVVHDVGSGLLIDLTEFGLTGEPLVQESVRAGAVTIFSGDKLLGGPQAGIIVGPAAVVRKLSKDPMARAMRPDKSTVAALEATLSLYQDRATAIREIPVLSMLTTDRTRLKKRARRLAKKIPGSQMEDGHSAVGGGSFPEAELATALVAIQTESCNSLARKLREHSPPVIARSAGGKVLLDVRTVADDELELVARAVNAANR